MPVTTLIPAYKPQYLRQLLSGLASQTVRPQRVIISDDSPDGSFRRALQAPELTSLVRALEPEVIEGPRKGGLENRRNLLRHWNGSSSHLHFLFDDDIIYPTFYQRHLKAHETGKVQCTVSRRWNANEAGDPELSMPLPNPLPEHPQRQVFLTSAYLFKTSFELMPQTGIPFNWLGELSHAVFARECAQTLLKHRLGGIPYMGLGDLGAFLACTLDLPLGYINENLGVFRVSPHQNTRQTESLIFRQGVLAWLSLAIAGRRLGRLSREQSLACIHAVGGVFLRDYAHRPDSLAITAAVNALIRQEPDAEERFLSAWEAYAWAF